MFELNSEYSQAHDQARNPHQRLKFKQAKRTTSLNTVSVPLSQSKHTQAESNEHGPIKHTRKRTFSSHII